MPRTNESPNPSCKNNTTGWFGGSRTTTLTGTVRTTGYRSSGMGSDTVIAAEGDGAPSVAWTDSVHIRPTASGVTASISMQFYNGGTFLSSADGSTVGLTAGAWTRLSVTGNAPSNTTRIRTTVSTTGSGLVDLAGHLLERSNTLGIYFDGDTANAVWDGTNGNSTSTLSDTVAITVPSIAPTSVFGSAAVTSDIDLGVSGIASATVFGTALVEVDVIRPPGIARGTAFGTPEVVGGPTSVTGVGIAPRAAMGSFGLTITFDPNLRKARRRPPVRYELVCVAVLPQPAGPPQFLAVDSINSSGLSYTDELSKPQSLDAGTKLSRLSRVVRDRLFDLENQPTELMLLRNGRPVFNGPLLGAVKRGDMMSLQAVGLLGYLRMWWITSDLVYKQVDQHLIAVALINHWQGSEYGNFGIDTSAVTPSGVLRDATYVRNEGHNIGERIDQLGRRENGFDVSVDPASRTLRLAFPWQGVDRSEGEDAIVFEDRNVTSGDIVVSVAPGDFASDGFGVGTNQSGDRYWSHQFNPQLRARAGRRGVFETWDGVSEQSTLDAHTAAMVTARGGSLVVPGPDLKVNPDADLAAYDVGDTIYYKVSADVDIKGAFRLRKRVVTVDVKSGRETASVEFV